MTKLSKTELQWMISALQYTAAACKAEADNLSGVLQGIALQREESNRATADKLELLLESGAKRIEIK